MKAEKKSKGKRWRQIIESKSISSWIKMESEAKSGVTYTWKQAKENVIKSQAKQSYIYQRIINKNNRLSM